LVFSDEHWINTNDHATRTQWAPSKEEAIPRESKNTFNIPSFMIWGAIGVGWRSELVFVKQRGPRSGDDGDGPRGMDAKKYVRICLSKIVPALLRRRLIFQQDGARAHMARSTTAYLRGKGVETVVVSGGLACSASAGSVQQPTTGRRTSVLSGAPPRRPPTRPSAKTGHSGTRAPLCRNSRP
jgi:hypothetical protein